MPPPVALNLTPPEPSERIEYRAHTIIVRSRLLEDSGWYVFEQSLTVTTWYADVEPPEADGIYRGRFGWNKTVAIIMAEVFIDALIDNDFPVGWQPIKEMYEKPQ